MPRTVDNPIGTIWGIRVHGVSDERNEIIKKLLNVVAVVHKRGMFAEKPHYHIYYVSDKEIKKDNLKRLLKATEGWKQLLLDPKTYSFSTSSDYTIESYWKYVWDKDKGQELITWNIPGIQLPVPVRSSENIISLVYSEGYVVKDVSAVATKLKPKTTEEKMTKFAQYVYECYQDDTDAPLDEDFVIDCLIEYSKGGFNDNAAGQYVRFAMYYVCDKVGDSLRHRKHAMKQLWKERVKKRFF